MKEEVDEKDSIQVLHDLVLENAGLSRNWLELHRFLHSFSPLCSQGELRSGTWQQRAAMAQALG